MAFLVSRSCPPPGHLRLALRRHPDAVFVHAICVQGSTVEARPTVTILAGRSVNDCLKLCSALCLFLRLSAGLAAQDAESFECPPSNCLANRTCAAGRLPYAENVSAAIVCLVVCLAHLTP